MIRHLYKNYFNMLIDQWLSKFNSYSSLSRLCHSPKVYDKIFLKKITFFNENNVPPAQLQKTPLSRKGILAAVPIC